MFIEFIVGTSLVRARSTECTEEAQSSANQADGNLRPNPVAGSTLTVHTNQSGPPVAVGQRLHALLVQQADLSP